MYFNVTSHIKVRKTTIPTINYLVVVHSINVLLSHNMNKKKNTPSRICFIEEVNSQVSKVVHSGQLDW